jgi:protein-disulfide isomerase
MDSMRHLLLKLTAVLLFAVALQSQLAPQAPPAGAPSEEQVNAYFKRMFGYEPNLQVHVLGINSSPIADLFDVAVAFVTPDGQQIGHWYVSRDLKHVVVGDVLPFGADPYATEREMLAKSAFGPTKGPADAKLLIVEFADLECPACREFANAAGKLRMDFPKARFVFQSFPLAQLHPWAVKAASFLDCLSRESNEKAFTFLDAVYSHQREIESDVRKTDPAGKAIVDEKAVNAEMRKYTEWAGADPIKTQACADSPATAERINRSVELAKTIGVTGTPTLYINGRRVGNPSATQYDALKTVVEFEEEQAK